MKFVSALFIFFLSMQAMTQAAMFAGYDEFCGIRVIVTPNPQLASASIDQYGRVIYVDPGVMSNWTMSRIFLLAHECGHHRKGHITPNGMWFRNTQFWATRAQELEADCWAAKALAANGYFGDIERTVRQFASQGIYPQGNYPSGQERAQVIDRCAGINTLQAPARFCSTPFGACQMEQVIPKKTPCFCSSMNGPIDGIAQ